MIVVKFSQTGQEYLLPGYADEKDYAAEILSAMTGVSRDKMVNGEISVTETEMIEEASVALRATPLSVGPAPLRPKLEVVR